MAGRVVRLFARNQIDLTGLTSGSTTEVPIAKDVDVSGMREGAVLVRVHAVTIATGGQYEVYLRPTAPTSEEPNAIFQAPSADVLASSTVVATAGTNTPALVRIPVTDTKAAWMTVYARATGATAAGNLKATLSLDLVTKD